MIKDNVLDKVEMSGLSVWLYIIRCIKSNDFQSFIKEDGLRGIHANPCICEIVMTEKNIHNQFICDLVSKKKNTKANYELLGKPNMMDATAEFRSHYEKADGKCGYIRCKANPHFDKPRSFTRAQFREFMFARSESNPKMISLIRKLKTKYRLKILVDSNESRELNAHRIQKFRLNEFVETFISSCYVGFRKADADIFMLALDVAHVSSEQLVYIENTQMLIKIADRIGIRGNWHTDYQLTLEKLASLGLEVET